MSFKHKMMRMRQARSQALQQAEAAPVVAKVAAVEIPAWAELAKMTAEQVAELAAALGIETTGSLMADKSAIHKAR